MRLKQWILTALIATAAAGCSPPDSSARQGVLDLMSKVCDYQVANPVIRRPRKRARPRRRPFRQPDGHDWIRAALYTGVMATYRATGRERHLEQARAWAERHGYALREPAWEANHHCAAQTYAELHALHPARRMIEPACRAFDDMIAERDRRWSDGWHWCDALFMSPPAMARVAAATKRRRYLDLMDHMWWRTTDRLYDADQGLFYRDERYIGRRSETGRKIFWSRGNGWVVAGLCRVLDHLPADDAMRPRYVAQLREMAAALRRTQGDDGLWGTSLLDREGFPDAETSGSAFFCFALAWGVNRGLLDRDTYAPAALKAWEGLVACVSHEGRLGHAQQPHYAPGPVDPDRCEEYATGAFLLAGSEVAKLVE